MSFNLQLIALGIVAIVLLAILIRIYNGLVELRNNVKKSWSNIDVLCKQRHDEIPKLIATCQQYMGYEQETLQQVMEARGSVFKALGGGKPNEFAEAESGLRQGMGKLFALAENYPDLKATNSFQQLQSRISGLENAIADRRELYNEAANVNNIRIRQFPDLIIARIFGFNHADLLEFSAEETADVDIKSLFNS